METGTRVGGVRVFFLILFLFFFFRDVRKKKKNRIKKKRRSAAQARCALPIPRNMPYSIFPQCLATPSTF